MPPTIYIVPQASNFATDPVKLQPLAMHQHGNTTQQVWVQQQAHVPVQQQASVNGNAVLLQTAGPMQQGPVTVYAMPQPSGQPVTLVKQPPQQLRVAQIAGSMPQLQPQQQQMLVAGAHPARQQLAPQVVLAPAATSVPAVSAENNQQIVYVNVNGTLQRGLVQNGSVYLLANDNGAAAVPATMGMQARTATAPQAHMVASTGGQAMRPVVAVQPQAQPQQQQQVMMQQVLHNGQVVQVSSALMASSSAPMPQALQLNGHVQQPMQPRAAMMPGALPAPAAGQQQQQPVVMVRPAAAAPNNTARMVMGSINATAGNPVPQLRMAPPQQQHLVLPAPQPSMPRGPTLQATVGMGQAAASQGMVGNAGLRPVIAVGPTLMAPGSSVSASTASLLHKMAVNTAATAQDPKMSPNSSTVHLPAMGTALMVPANNAAGTDATGKPPAVSSELSSPVAPPTTPGMANATATAAMAAAGVINNGTGSLAGDAGAAAALQDTTVTVLTGSQSPAVHGVIGGHRSSSTSSGKGSVANSIISPTGSMSGSQPGTPSRSNSMGDTKSASSNGSASEGEGAQVGTGDSKTAVMRLVARSFIETGIALEQALSMIQAADRDMLAAAFAVEAAAAALPGQQGGNVHAADPGAVTHGGVAELGGEQVVLPGSGSRLSGLQLAVGTMGLLDDGSKDTAPGPDKPNLGSWGFSLFASGSHLSDLGDGSTSGSLGSPAGIAAKLHSAGAATSVSGANDSATASLLASLNM